MAAALTLAIVSDEVRVEVPLSARQIQVFIVGDGHPGLQTTAIVSGNLLGKVFTKHLLNKATGHLGPPSDACR
jgi:hypothetical protein